jgi:hypothetical protein
LLNRDDRLQSIPVVRRHLAKSVPHRYESTRVPQAPPMRNRREPLGDPSLIDLLDGLGRSIAQAPRRFFTFRSAFAMWRTLARELSIATDSTQ